MATCIPRVDGLSMDPRGLERHSNTILCDFKSLNKI